MRKRLFDPILLVRFLALIPVLVLLGMWSFFAISHPDVPMPIHADITYRQDAADWLPLDDGTSLSSMDGDLSLSLRITQDIPATQCLYFRLDHIDVQISLNGQSLFRTDHLCGDQWINLPHQGIAAGDTLEILLRNPHHYGNRQAYDTFLDTFHSASHGAHGLMVSPQTLVLQNLGICVCVTSVLVLGLAATTCLLQKPAGNKLINLGLFSLLAGLYIALDAGQDSARFTENSFRAQLTSICLMLAVFELGLFIRFNFGSTMRRIVNGITAIEAVLACAVVGAYLAGAGCLHDAMGLWYAAQLVLCPVLLVCLLREICTHQSTYKRTAIACTPLVACLLLDILNIHFGLYPSGLLTKLCFLVLFFGCVGYSLKRIPASLQAAERTHHVETELKNTQTALATSQIRSHFIFNILNAISGMCKYDPEMADETVVRFARYLRTNIDIMQQEKIVTFDAAVQHLQDYVALEQIRFGNKIRFRQEIRVDGFLIPSLVLQPVVENAIKHGLTPKPEGGTVFLKSWTDGKNFIITIHDDGVGFDPTAVPKKENSGLGLENVRSRLDHIMKGTMVIDSKPGEGTTVTITIPRKESFRCI